MSNPRNATSDIFGRRVYTWQGHQYPSVTSILRSVAKPALVPWAAGMVADRAVDHAGLLPSMIEAEGRDATRRWLAAAPTEKKVTGQDVGTHVHEIADMLANDLPMPALPEGVNAEDVAGYITQWHKFTTTYWPEWIATECTVYSREHDYAGTFDSIARIGDTTYLMDLKTGKDIYPEVSMQLAAYGNAEFMAGRVIYGIKQKRTIVGENILRTPDGFPRRGVVGEDGGGLPTEDDHDHLWFEGALPKFDAYAVLHLRPDSFRLIEIDADWPAFLAARELSRFLDRKDWQKTIVLPQALEATS